MLNDSDSMDQDLVALAMSGIVDNLLETMKTVLLNNNETCLVKEQECMVWTLEGKRMILFHKKGER